VDVVFDAIGGAHVARSRAALSADGRLVMYGFTGAEVDGASVTAAFLGTFGRLGVYLTASWLWTRRTATFFGVLWDKEGNPAVFHRHAAACM
jgi:NADPH:quinone reductase-like Zn-dependent oxidoreductase